MTERASESKIVSSDLLASRWRLLWLLAAARLVVAGVSVGRAGDAKRRSRARNLRKASDDR
jgi:hypothetical protein